MHLWIVVSKVAVVWICLAQMLYVGNDTTWLLYVQVQDAVISF